MLNFFNTKKEKAFVQDCQNELNTHPIFKKRDKDNLNPVYDKELEKLGKKKLPFGVRKNGKIY